MIETSRRILKSDDVELDGQYHLDLAPEESGACEPAHTGAIASSPQARIVENHPEHAVVEVTCSCGAKVYLKCEYSGGEIPKDS